MVQTWLERHFRCTDTLGKLGFLTGTEGLVVTGAFPPPGNLDAEPFEASTRLTTGLILGERSFVLGRAPLVTSELTPLLLPATTPTTPLWGRWLKLCQGLQLVWLRLVRLRLVRETTYAQELGEGSLTGKLTRRRHRPLEPLDELAGSGT